MKKKSIIEINSNKDKTSQSIINLKKHVNENRRSNVLIAENSQRKKTLEKNVDINKKVHRKITQSYIKPGNFKNNKNDENSPNKNKVINKSITTNKNEEEVEVELGTSEDIVNINKVKESQNFLLYI